MVSVGFDWNYSMYLFMLTEAASITLFWMYMKQLKAVDRGCGKMAGTTEYTTVKYSCYFHILSAIAINKEVDYDCQYVRDYARERYHSSDGLSLTTDLVLSQDERKTRAKMVKPTTTHSFTLL